MKRVLLLATVFATAITIGCRKIEVDGNGNGNGNGNTPGSTVVLSGRITKDVTLKKADENILSGIVYISKRRYLDS